MAQDAKYAEILAQVKKANGLLVESKPSVTEDPKQDAGKPESGKNKNTEAGSNAPVPSAKVEKLASVVSAAIKGLESVATAEPEKTATASTEPEKTTDPKKADASLPEGAFTPEYHFKLAHAILETEEGMAYAEKILAKKAGAEAAQALIAQAFEQETAAKKAATEGTQMIGQDAILAAAIEDLETAADYEKVAEALLAQDGDEPVAGTEGAEDITEEDVVQAVQVLLQEGEIDEDDAQEILHAILGEDEEGAGAEDITEEDVVQALQVLVQEGEIDEDDAQEILHAILGADEEA